MKNFEKLGLGIGLVLGFGLLGACGDDSAAPGGAGSGASGTGGESNNGVCILHNCKESSHCEGCSDGRTTCRIDAGETSGRCVACGDDGTGCPPGYECSSFGNCVPEGLTCPTDATGTPQISCSSSADCAACDPAHLVCDNGACVACSANDTSECQATDICKAGQCAPACGTDCTVDNDCMQCNGAKACNNHKCSECSATYACPSGESCNLTTGTCEKNCGLPSAPGTCNSSADCVSCGGEQNSCHIPLGSNTGTCGPNATGCSDLGAGALALPPPYNQITNTCSSDNDCVASQAGIQYNVGEALRDLLDSSTVLGQTIGDAMVAYPMPVCASITLQDTSCGVCVPCRQDSDCQNINLDTIAGDLFPGVGGALLAVVFNQLFGPDEHNLYMYCESVAAGYGICTPCPGLVNDCSPGGAMGGNGTCDHPPTTAGTPLDPTCDACAATVCASDPFCCETAWDELCVSGAASACSSGNCHDVCTTGSPMGATCGTCAAAVCAADAYCCDTSWDSVCVSQVQAECGQACN